MDWSRREIIKLIGIYRQNECLWNFKNPDYRSLDKRYCCWDKISRVMHKSIDEVKKKMKHLRTAYNAEKKKVDASKLKAKSPEDIYESSLFYYDQINFLESFIVLRRSEMTESNGFNETSSPKCEDSKIEWTVTEFGDLKMIQEESQNEDQRPNQLNQQQSDCASSVPQSPNRSTSTTSSSSSTSQEEEKCILPPKRAKLQRRQKRIIRASNAGNLYTCFTKCLALQLQQLPVQEATTTMNEIHTLVTKNLLKYMESQEDRGDDGDYASC